MVSRRGRKIGPEIDDKNVRPAVSIEIGDKDLTVARRSGDLTGDYLCGTLDVPTSRLTKSDDDGHPRRGAVARAKDHVWNPVAVEVSVANSSGILARIPKSRQNGRIVDFVWNL